MEKKAILAIILTFLVIVFWSSIQSKLFPPDPNKEVKQERVAPSEKVVGKKIDVKEETLPKKERPLTEQKVVVKKEVRIETQNYWAVFTSEDARLKHFKLKEYEDRVEQSGGTKKLIQFIQGLIGRKKEEPERPKPLDLVNTNEEEGLPLGVTFLGTHPFSSENWEVDKDQLRLLRSGERGEITFTKSLENGLKLIKRYRFSSNQYAIGLDVEIENNSSKEIDLQLGLQWIGKIELEKLADEDNKDYGLKYAFLKNQKVERNNIGGTGGSGCTPGCETRKTKLQPFDISDKGEMKWFAFEGEYFTALLVPPPSERNLTLSITGSEKNLLKTVLINSPISIASQKTVNIPYLIYIGPKEIGRLRELGVEAEKLIDFGFFTIIAKPLLWFLKLTNTVTRNFGIDILILSILIKIIFLPLTQISFKSMKEMQKVGPEMARLKETYKNDKTRLQQETMLLYKRRKINPMSGCIPMLIQIPVFIALYNALQNAIQMRHAPFFLWITDLSAKDPIYITPLIMGATMVLQQKMTPTAADPTQAKLFLLMPVMFTFLFLNFPSGLVLYWLVNNVLSIAHQYYLTKKV